MDAAVKHVRDGVVREESCPMLFVADSLEALGGRGVFNQIITMYMEAVARKKAQASHVILVALERAPIYVPEAVSNVVTVLDMHKQMHGWNNK